MNFYGESLEQLKNNGYKVIPVAYGQKRPVLNGWEENQNVVNPAYDKCGIGCCTGLGENLAPYAVDIDCTDNDVMTLMRQKIEDTYPDAPSRVGYAPKTLYLFACEEVGITKITSPWFIDQKGEKHRLEILGAGQQFVAYNVHPDTGKEYLWDNTFGDSPLNTPLAQVQLVTKSDLELMLKWFSELCLEAGMNQKGTITEKNNSINNDDEDWDTEGGVDFKTDDEIWEYLDLIESSDYDTWVRVGQAIHHQFSQIDPDSDLDTSTRMDNGFQIWNQWSQKSDNYPGEKELRKKWRSFYANKRGGVTFRSVIKLANDNKKEFSREQYMTAQRETLELLESVEDTFMLKENVLPEMKKILTLHPDMKELFARKLKDRYQELTSVTLDIAEARRMIKVHKVIEQKSQWYHYADNCPSWGKNWVYVAVEDRIVNKITNVSLTAQAFRNKFNSKMEEPGDDAFKFLLDNELIPKVDARMYHPQQAQFWRENGKHYMNSYTKGGVDQDNLPDWTVEGREAAAAIETHFSNICGGKHTREYGILTSWFKYNIENPGKKIRWSPVIQGKQGDGKSLLIKMMGCVLGNNNVKSVNTSSVTNPNFNAWACNACVIGIEELKIQGHNRFEPMNALKPVITNDVIEISEKFMPLQQVVNVSNILIVTNYKDALPVEEADRRFFILFSKVLLGSLPKNYFENIFDALENHCEFITKWFIEMVDYHHEFNPDGVAPTTVEKETLKVLTEAPIVQIVDDIIMDKNVIDVCKEALVFKSLKVEVIKQNQSISDSQIYKHLVDIGFKRDSSRHRVATHANPITLWIREDDKIDFFIDQVRERYESDDYTGFVD